MMTPEEAKKYNRCCYLEYIDIERDSHYAEEVLEKGITNGYFTEEDIEIIQGFIDASRRLECHAKANRRYDYDE